MLRPSFVPPPPIRLVRDLTCYRSDLLATHAFLLTEMLARIDEVSADQVQLVNLSYLAERQRRVSYLKAHESAALADRAHEEVAVRGFSQQARLAGHARV